MSLSGPDRSLRGRHRGKLLLAMLAILACGGRIQIASAQEAVEYSDLVRRMQEQDERIRQLEAQQQGYQRLPAVHAGYSNANANADAKAEEEANERFEKLEDQISDLKKKNYVFSGSSNSTMKLSGRIHTDYWGFPQTSPGANAFENGDADDSVQDRIGFRRVRFGVAGDVKDNMTYKIEMEFAGGIETEFRDVYLGFTDLPGNQSTLIGNQKRPYGLDHLNSSRYNVFLERPFVIEAVNQDARRLGICTYGFSEDMQYNWRYGVFNQRNIQDEGNYISDHFQPEFAGRFANTWWYDEASDGRGYAHWGIAGTAANPDGSTLVDASPRAIDEARFRSRPEARTRNRWIDTGVIAGASWYELIALEGVLNFGPVQWVGEYQNVFVQRDAGAGNDLHFDGGYMYVSYFLTGEHMPWDRESGTLDRIKPFENFWLVDTCDDGVRAGWGAWQVAARLSYANFSDEDILGGTGRSVTLGVNWYWNANARMQFNYIYGDIDNHRPVDGYTSAYYQIVGTRLCIDF